jgi:triphosphoribosyl-dephospho-CoA synthetase
MEADSAPVSSKSAPAWSRFVSKPLVSHCLRHRLVSLLAIHREDIAEHGGRQGARELQERACTVIICQKTAGVASSETSAVLQLARSCYITTEWSSFV